MSKYYQPIIEEFHVGFEYETIGKKLNTSNGRYEDEWKKRVVSDDDGDIQNPFDNFNYGIQTQTIRVKHLDQEDIEYFGWEKSRLKDRYYNPVFKMHMIHQGTRVAIFYQDLQGDVPRFDGVINNKSEFKKLLKQLGV